MHDLLAEVYKLITYTVIVAILIRRTGGVSFFFRVIMRILKLSYNNPQLKKSEETAYDLQLFKALEGINAKNSNDALLISDEINSGTIKKSNFIFTSTFGHIGSEKQPIGVFAASIILIILLTLFGFFSVWLSNSFKEGYYRFQVGENYEFVSLSKITNMDENITVGVDNCDYYIKKGFTGNLRSQTCSLLLRSNRENSDWLLKKIAQSDIEFRVLFYGGIFYLLYSLHLIIGLYNFRKTNQKILNIKNRTKSQQEPIFNNAETVK